MQNRWLVAGLVASIALNLAVVGFYIYERAALRPRPPLPPFAGPMHGPMHRMRMRMEPRMDSLGRELMAARVGLMAMVREGRTDSVRAESLFARIGGIEQQMNRLAFENARQLLESLPPEARQRFIERLEKRGGPGSRPGPRHWRRGRGPDDAEPEGPGGM